MASLKCENCTLRFDKPMLLPCGATSCLRCLRRLAAEHPNYIMCPDCLKRHEVPDGASIESFPVNKLIYDLMENRVSISGESGPRRSAPPPPTKAREIELCSKCGNKTASFERCAHCSSTFCIFCFEKHIEAISEEIDNYVAAVEEHCAVAGQIVSFYSKMSSGIGCLTEREKRKEAIIEWGEQLKSLFIRAVGTRVGQLCTEVDTLIDEQASKMTSLDESMEKVQQIQARCANIAEELRSSARPNVPLIFQTCGQVDEEIRTLEQSLEGLGLPYLDNETVSGDTQRVLEEIKSLGKLVCDSKRTIEDIVATQQCLNDEQEAGEPSDGVGNDQDPVSFYESLTSAVVSTTQDAQGEAFGPIWDAAAFSTPDGSTKQLVVIHNKVYVTLVDANSGASVVTFELQNPSTLPDLKLDIKHVAVMPSKKLALFTQNDRVGVFSMPLGGSFPSSNKEPVLRALDIAIQGPGDCGFCGIAVDERSKVVYACDQYRSRVTCWSLENSALLATFATSGSGFRGDFKPFKCSLSPIRTGGTTLLAVTDYTNERVCVLALANPTNGQFMPDVVNRGQVLGAVQRPCGVAFDAAGNLLVAEGPSRRIQVFAMPDCQSMMAFPAGNDKLRSPRSVSVFFYGRFDRQIVVVADNAANALFFYKIGE